MKYPLKAIFSFLIGATLLCFFSTLQKLIIETPLDIEAFFVPFLIGGLCGLLISLRERRLNKEIQSRIRVEEKLKESEERQRTIVDKLGMGIMVIDPVGHKVVQVNPEAARIFGVSSDEIIGKTCHEFMCPAGEGDCPVTDHGQDINDTQRLFLDADGNEIQVLKTVIPIQLNGRQHYLEGFIDNSKRWEAEKKLRDTVERFKSLTNHLNVGYYRNTPGPKGKFIEANSSICNMFGYESRDEFLKKPVSDLYLDPDERTKISAEMLQKGVIKNKKIQLKRSDGTLLIGSVSAAVMKNENDEIECFDGIIEDVTERERIAQELRKSEKRYKELFNSITDVVFTHDLEGRFTSANNALYELFGFDVDEFIGHRVSDFMNPKITDKFENEYLKGIKKNGHYEGISSYFRKDGSKIYLEYRCALVQPEDGKPFISGIGRDVTERVVAERKIEKLQKQMLQAHKMEAIGTLAGGIAHDFNNILSAVIGYTELALFDVKEGSHLHDSLTEALNSGKRATDLVKQILTFSRQSELMAKPVHLNPLVKEALKMLRSTIPTSIDLEENIVNDFLTVKANPTQIQQVIVNLVTNASHALIEDRGLIKIELEPIILGGDANEVPSGLDAGSYARLTISDNGSGISKEHIDHIFEPYFTTKEKHKGTGLGLSVVHGIVETCNGHITVDSEVNEGTTFRLYFPLAKQAVADRQIDWTGPLPTGKEHILFVDDESAIVDIQKQILTQLGYTVTARTSSTEALAAFRSMPEKFDIVITDMTMPNMTGDKLAQEIRKIRPGMPIIICTGFSEKFNRQQALQMNIDGFMMKPVDTRKMATIIQKALKVRRVEPSLAAIA